MRKIDGSGGFVGTTDERFWRLKRIFWGIGGLMPVDRQTQAVVKSTRSQEKNSFFYKIVLSANFIRGLQQFGQLRGSAAQISGMHCISVWAHCISVWAH
ncbi:MAG: hypothetical protein WCL19_11510, partial [Verrucomicrobiota bacterium]